jgi:hypothetical protein
MVPISARILPNNTNNSYPIRFINNIDMGPSNPSSTYFNNPKYSNRNKPVHQIHATATQSSERK